MQGIGAFNYDTFIGYFPEFADTDKPTVFACGRRGLLHIGSWVSEMPLQGAHREYAQCLMAAHILRLKLKSLEDPGTSGGSSSVNGNIDDAAGIPFKTTVGSILVENTKPNTFTQDDWTFWLSQTSYGRELLAFLYVHAPPIYISKSTSRDLP